MESLIETFRRLGPARLAIMGGVSLALLMFFVLVSLRVSSPEMQLLYSELSERDVTQIVSLLEENDFNYRMGPDGGEVLVAKDQVGQARMILAQEGLPNGGSMGYELFDEQSGFGQTNFVQNINQVRALEGELSRTISSLEPVRSARVHLVLPQRELFSRETRDPSASVFVGLRGRAQLSNEQVRSIQSLVASAVPELEPAKVALIDQDGNLLAEGTSDEDQLQSVKAEEMRLRFEARMTRQIEDIVGRIVGFENVRANVTADIKQDRVTTQEEIFDPETQVARSTQLSEESVIERAPPNDNTSVENELPGVQEELLVDAEPVVEENRVEEITNFEISRTVRNVTREGGEINRLSVAVLVDGTYTTDADGNKVYVPRAQDEIEKIETLVSSAVGYDFERGDSLEVVNLKFAEIEVEPEALPDTKIFGFERSDLLDTAEIVTVAIMIILVVLLVLQPMVSRLLETESGFKGAETEDQELLAAATEIGPALSAPEKPRIQKSEGEQQQLPEETGEEMIDMQSVEGKVKASSVKKVEDLIDTYPNEAVNVIRGWMSSD